MKQHTRAWFVRSAAAILAISAISCPAPSALVTVLAATPTIASAADPTLDERLTWLTEKLEKRRQELHIPGMAIAVVQDDKVIFAKGFGQKNIAKNEPATPDTLFGIGSSTKAFTSMLCAMMVDEGKMSFDDPVTKHLPYFKLHTDDWTASTTMRDALAHRTGLTRTDMIWAGNKVSRKEAIEQLQQAEAFAPPRTAFLYNNMMFAAAGEAATAAAGAASWEQMVQDRILTPLGMSNTTPYSAKGRDDPRRAQGYSYIAATSEYRELPMRLLDAAAPAGSINSSVMDMTHWLRFLLNKGQFEGKRLVKAELFDSDLWAPQMPMTPTSSYGMGWMLDKWKDNKCVHHGGNIDGYASMVAMLPDKHVGLSFLANVTASSLQEECKTLTWTALYGSAEDLKPAAAQNGAKSEAELQKYVGSYDFAALHVKVAALIKDGKLCLDVPGQTVYALKWPNEKGRWVFELTDAIECDFQPGDDGAMKSVTLYQAGQTFVMPRQSAEKPAAPVAAAPNAKSEAELKPYLGKYDFAVQKSQITALIQDGKLCLDVPGQRVYALKWPNEKNRWVFEFTDAIEVDFQPGDDGRMKSITMYQAGQTFVLPRVAGAEDPLPLVSEVSAMVQKGYRGTPPKSFRLAGTVNFVHQGVSGPCTILADAEKYMMKFDFGKFGYITVGYDGQNAYEETDLGDSKILHGEEADQIKAQHPRSAFEDPAKFYAKVEPLAWDMLKKIKAVKVKLTPQGAPASTMWYDSATGRPVREEQSRVVSDLGINMSTKIGYGEYKPLGNVDYPSRITIENQFQGRAVLSFDKMEADVTIDPKDLAMPASLKK